MKTRKPRDKSFPCCLNSLQNVDHLHGCATIKLELIMQNGMIMHIALKERYACIRRRLHSLPYGESGPQKSERQKKSYESSSYRAVAIQKIKVTEVINAVL